MTKPKQSGQCPICLKVLQHTSKHIREVHRIQNTKERSILNAISTGRIDIQKGTCPVPGCGLFRRRLSKHIEGHTDLLPGRREAYKQVARRDAGLKLLSELRATNPQPPMASVLDLEDSLASECRHPSCIQREFRIRELEAQLLFARRGSGEVHPRTRPQEAFHGEGTSTQKRKRHREGTSTKKAKDHGEGTSTQKRKRHREGTSTQKAKDHGEGTSTQKRKRHREGTSTKKAKDHGEGTSTTKRKRHSVDEDRLRKRRRRIHVVEDSSSDSPRQTRLCPSAVFSSDEELVIDLDPEELAVPLDPEEPAVPLDPEEPAVPLDPEEPAVALDPEEPAVPLDPEEPAVPLDPEEPAVPLDPEEPAVPLDPEEPAVALDPEEPAVPLDPEEPAVAQDKGEEGSEESGVSEPNLQESSGDDDVIDPDFVPSEPAGSRDPFLKPRKIQFPSTSGEAAGEEEETRLAVAENVKEIAAADRDRMLGKSRGAGVQVHPALQTIFKGRCKGTTGDFNFPQAIADYMEQYGKHIFRPQGTRKVQENCVSRTVRAKTFVAYMMFGSPKPHWDWGFMSNVDHLRAYPAVLRALQKKPNTAQTYFQQVRAFVEYFNNKVPKGCRLTGDQRTEVFWELQKVAKDTGRSIAAHQLAVKGQKQERLLPKEALVSCRRLARERIPSLLDAVEAAPPNDRSTRFLFLGYLSAYLACIYGHRTGVFAKMTQAEVKRAVGDDQSGYLINVLEHKTVQTYGHAQVYLTAEEYGWCRRWLDLLRRTVPSNVYFFCSFGEGPIKDLRGYMGRAWTDMGLGPVPTFMDIRSAVATYNYESNQDPKTRESVAQFMCHSERVQDKFYALHKTVKRAKKIREVFVALSMMEPDDGPGTSRDSPSPQMAVKRRKDSLTVKAAKKIRHLLSPQKRKSDKEQRQMRVRLRRLQMNTN